VPRTKVLQTSFSAGELSPSLIMRRDTEQYRDGAKSLRNNRILVSGGAARRPGSQRLDDLPGDARLEDFIVSESVKYVVAFGNARMDAFLPDGTAAGSLTGCPWTLAQAKVMDYCQTGNTCFLTHNAFHPQQVTRTGASSWSRQDFVFFSSAAGRLNQPYFKLAPVAATLAPSALTGTGITLQLAGVGAGHWTANHVGRRVRYMGREILITSVTDGDTAIGDVQEDLPGTFNLTVGPVSGYAIGEAVEGATSGAKGVITDIPTGTVVAVTLTEKLLQFSTGEDLIGPHQTRIISAISTVAPAAIVEWDEALFTPGNGYPSCVEIHRNRLLFAGHPEIPNALIGSAIDNLYNFDVGDASDGDAIFELIGDAGAAEIKQMHSAEQLLLFTDKGPYYVPENVASPFRPSSIAFNHFGGTWPAASVRTHDFDGGVVMVSGSLIVKCRPTGDAQRQWTADEVSLLSDHLVKAPVDSAVTTNFNGGPERYAMFVNEDGTAAVMQLVEAQRIRNFVPWDTEGSYTSFASLGEDVYAVVEREIDGDTVYCLELFDVDRMLDCSTIYTDLDDVPADYGDTDLVVRLGRFNLGPYPVTLADPPTGDYEVGIDFVREIETLPPIIETQEGNHSGDPMRIMRADVFVIDSVRFASQGLELMAYQVTDNPEEEPPLRSGPQTFRFLGWRTEPTITITQPDPGPLTIPAIRMEVAF
jgi:hypothetical protein